MSSVVRLYRRFDRWAEKLPRTQYAILLGSIFFVVWVGVGLLLGGLSLFVAVFSALAFAMTSYYLDPR